MYQLTVANNIEFNGIGLHTGQKSKIIIKPSLENTGIIFKKKDDLSVGIKAIVDNVSTTKRGTTISSETYDIHTVEHVLSALYALSIDNAIIEIDGNEIPILDGSTKEFYEKIKFVGTKQLNIEKEFIVIKEKVEVCNNDSKITVLPYDGFKITFEIDFENSSIGKQSFVLTSLDEYEKQISESRTFCTFNEIVGLQDSGLALGGNLDNAIIYIDNNINSDDLKNFKEKNRINTNEDFNTIKNSNNLNNKKLVFENEAVRHKILDLIGDMSLLGKNIKGHFISYKGGHELNIQLVKKIQSLYSNKVIFNKKQVENIIPHRDPFLLIDEIVDIEEGKYVKAVKYVNESEDYFRGHFPGEPMMPGVLIVECLAQASCFLSMSTVDNPSDKLMLLSVIKSAKFMKKVVPGDKLFLEVHLLKYKLRNALIKGVASVSGEVVAESEWMATVVKKNENS